MWKCGGGRGRIPTLQEDRCVSLVEKRNKNFTPSQIAAGLAVATNSHISSKSILGQLNPVVFCAQKPVRCIPLQLRHRRGKLSWCKEHIVGVSNSDPEWCSSTSLVSLWQVILATSYCGERGEHVMHNIMFVSLIHMAKACSCGQACTMRKICFTSLSKVALHSSSTAERLFWIMFVFFKGVICPEILFVDNNVRPQRSTNESHTLESEHINRIQWLKYFSKLNPIDHTWNALGKCVSQKFVISEPCKNHEN